MAQYIEAAHLLFGKSAEKPIKLTPASQPNESLDLLLSKATEALGINHVKDFNVAVCGCHGSGKSTFITSFLHLDNNDVGVIKSVDGIISYRNTNFPNLVFWEMPELGMDNLKGPEENYFMDKKLYAFDCILILTSSTFSDLDAQISIDARNWNKPFAMVKTKADIHAKDIALAERCYMNIAGVILRLEINRSLGEQPKIPDSAPFFLINSLTYNEHYSYQCMHENGYVDNSLREIDEGDLFNYVIDSLKPRFNSVFDWKLNNQVQEDNEDEYGFTPFQFEEGDEGDNYYNSSYEHDGRNNGYDNMMEVLGALLFISSLN